MNTSQYKKGKLTYRVYEKMSVDELISLISSEWDDGFLAFSKGEIRLKDIPTGTDLKKLFSETHTTGQYEGYLMEAGLWRQSDGVLEEIAIERDGTKFFVQLFRLLKDENSTEGMPCYFRENVNVRATGQSKLFQSKDLSATEVIMPEYRLHIYITTKR